MNLSFLFLVGLRLIAINKNSKVQAALSEYRDDGDIHAKREAARVMLQAYVSSKSEISELKQVFREAKLLFGEVLSDQAIKDLIFNAAFAKESEEQLNASPTNIGLSEKCDSADDALTSYADKHIQGMMDTIVDPDCMSREFDVTDESYDPKDAKEVFKKCKLLVLRNVFSLDFLSSYRQNFTEFIAGVHTGRISQKGTTTNGEYYYLHDIDHKRWELALPKNLAHEKLLVNKHVMNILMDRSILGRSLTLHSLGTAIAENGANAQRWHKDEDYIFEDDSIETSGIAGHDLPSYAVTMMVPLLNMTHQHGPTEFCMGTSHLSGIDDPKVRNKSLISKSSNYAEYNKFHENEGCPPRFWRSPHLKFGDMLLFDYQLEHRGGQNISPELRAIMYMTYSRYWYKDSNFVNGQEPDSLHEDEEEQSPYASERRRLMRTIMKSARFALPDEATPCVDEKCRNFMDSFVLEEIDALIRNDRFSSRWEEDSTGSKHRFLISDIDVASEKLDVMINGTKAGSLQNGGTLMTAAKAGEHVEVQASDGFVYKAWEVVPGQGQLVLSKSTINVPEK